MRAYYFHVFCLAAAMLLGASTARGNVYATDIKVNGNFHAVTNTTANSAAITYRLNQDATAGVTVNIWQGTTNIASIAGGTSMGLNTVLWGNTNNSGALITNGNYAVSITAAASGFTTWQQISVDTNPGMPAYYPLGIAVDNNTNSPYYGRVIMGCALTGSSATPTVPLAAQLTGLYKMNADGSQADEGWFGDANYTQDDNGDAPQPNQMPDSRGSNPMKIRIGEDDRIYWVDRSYIGAIVACDMEATTYQLVINKEGYFENPDIDDLTIGIQNFDVSGTTTTNAAVWLCDNDFPCWGIWMYHLTDGAADLNDNFGVQAVQTGFDLALNSAGGCMIDDNLDIFVGQYVTNEQAVYGVMLFTNWNAGVLPPPDDSGDSATNFVVGGAAGEVAWGYGCGVDAVCTNDSTFEAAMDTVINSRQNPTLVACPMATGINNGNGGGIRVLNATNGNIISVTNGENVQSLANIDSGQSYTCAAWDNVGNLYAASTTRNLWRVWTPPGPSTNTTTGIVTITEVYVPASATLKITSIALSGTTVTIDFSAPASDPASDFTLQSAGAVGGPYNTITSALVHGSSGSFTVSTTTSGTTQFYRIKK